MMGNALNVSVNGNHSEITNAGVTTEGVLIIGLAWMNQFDYQANKTNELIFHGTQWNSGGYSRWPPIEHSITSYQAIDAINDMLFDQAQFPNLNQVVIAGHSMGGQAVERYALLAKQKKYDQNIRYWVGNPGSWAWLTPDRPYGNTSCPDSDDWIYGIGGNTAKISKYGRADVIANKQAVIDRYRGRNVHYALGLLDDGPGDTHCQARMQGGNHLDRGAQFVMSLGAMDGGFPATHTVDFIANVSHQDYPMMSANVSLYHLFADNYNTRFPDLQTLSNPSGDDVPKINDGTKAFATPIHLIISYALLGGSILGVILAFSIMPCLFPVSKETSWETEHWEGDQKRKLL